MKLPSTKILYRSIEPDRRVLAVSDIHGHLSYLKNALKKVGFCKDDVLIIVGDIIEKGPDNLGTLRYVMELCEVGNVIPLIGNVDAYRLHVINDLNEGNATSFYDYILALREWCGTSFYDELANECGFTLSSPEDVLKAKEPIISHFSRELDFLAELPTVVETPGFTFVHGGLRDANVADNAQRGFFELTKYDDFANKTSHVFDKYVVVGHWPVSLYGDSIQQLNPVIDRNKRIISIDGGCGVKSFCQLNVLVIPHINCSIDEVRSVSYDSLPTVKALEDQSPSEVSVNICWTNRKVTMLERGDEFSYIRHDLSGHQLFVPNSYLRSDSDCRDYTDYVLPICSGDTISPIAGTSRGIIAKKDGVIGWYYGKYEELK